MSKAESGISTVGPTSDEKPSMGLTDRDLDHGESKFDVMVKAVEELAEEEAGMDDNTESGILVVSTEDSTSFLSTLSPSTSVSLSISFC